MGEKVLAGRGAMARAAKKQGRACTLRALASNAMKIQ
jgi:hypothetical protein